MTIKSFFRIVPNLLLIGILITTVIASFDGVILSYVISNVTRFNAKSTVVQVVTYVTVSLLIWGLIYFAMAFKQVLVNQAVKLLNIKIKNSFVFDQVTKPDFQTKSSDSVSKIFNDFKLVETNYFVTFFELCGSLLMGIVSGCYILYLNLPLGILFILFSLIPMLSSKLFGRVLTESSTTWQKNSGTYLGKVMDLFNGIQTIKTYLAERVMFMDTENYLKKAESSYKKMNDYQAWAIFVSAILSVISFLLPLGTGLIFVINGKAQAATIIAIFLASDRVVGPFRNVAQYLNEMKTTDNIRKDLKLEPIKFTQPQEDRLDAPSINFDNVSFAYGNKEPLLHDLSLMIPFRSKILITGKSGAGKSTVFNLIEGFIKPTSGRIFLQDGTEEIDDIAGAGELAYIKQSPFLFNDTLRFNMTLGRQFADKDCLAALKAVGLLVELGNDCLDKNYGENGNNLSGGQKQRVEIARALLYHKKIILIDEATSALDNEMSRKVQQVINNLDCTVLEIAHHYDEKAFKDNGFKHYVLQSETLEEQSE